MMKNSVKENLENLYLENRKLIADISFEEMINDLIDNAPQAYDFNTGKTSNLFNKREIESLRKASTNEKINNLFNKAKELNIDEAEIIKYLKIDLENSFLAAKAKIVHNEKEEKNQIIFLEHDHQPQAYLCGFGEGDYPIFKAPEYLYGYHKKEFYNGVGNIDYRPIWKNLIALIEILENSKIDDAIRFEERFQALEKMTLYKSYLLLNQAFEELEGIIFKDIPIKKPLFIFGNEHDCNPMNIYVFE